MTITIRYRGLDDKWIDTCKDCVWQNGTKIHGPPCDDICATHPTGYVLNQGRFADAPHYPVPALRERVSWGRRTNEPTINAVRVWRSACLGYGMLED